MGDIFCLVILESGRRRKLKLRTGTYDELLAGLASMTKVDSKTTQVQMFDADLDDFVDLLPGDVVPNRAKIHVTQNSASALGSLDDSAVPSSPPPESTVQIADESSPTFIEFVKQECPQPSAVPSSSSNLPVSVGSSGGPFSLDASDAGDQTTIDDSMDASETMIEEPQENETAVAVIAEGEPGASDDAVTPRNSSRILRKARGPSGVAKICAMLDAASRDNSSRSNTQEEEMADGSGDQDVVDRPEPIEDIEGATPIQQLIINLLLEIRQEARVMLHQLRSDRMCTRCSGAQAAPSPAASVHLPTLPAHSIEELEAAEAALADDRVAAALRKRLTRLGGTSLREVGSSVMTAVMSIAVQQQFSLHGKKGKRPFVNMKLCRVATDAISEKLGVDFSEALGFIQRWLPGACDRGGGRKRRLTENHCSM